MLLKITYYIYIHPEKKNQDHKEWMGNINTARICEDFLKIDSSSFNLAIAISKLQLKKKKEVKSPKLIKKIKIMNIC